MQRHTKSGDHYSFQCYGYLKGKCRASHYVTEKDIAAAVLNALQEVLEAGTVDYEVKSVVKAEDSHEMELLKNMVDRLELKEKRAKAAYMDGIDSLEEYKQNKLLKSRRSGRPWPNP